MRYSGIVPLILAACAPPLEEYDPFVVPADRVYMTIGAIVLAPVVPPPDVAVSAAAAARIDSVVGQQLREAGFRVVPAAEYGKIWDRILQQMGGFFDPLTGVRDESKFAAARGELLEELLGRFETQVVMYAELEVVDAFVEGGLAEWDGMTQRIGRNNTIAAQFRGSFEQGEYGSRDDGVVSAISLVLAVDGADGTEMYRNFGGLEVVSVPLEYAPTGTFTLIADDERVSVSAGLALGPLLRGWKSRSSQP
jgi:hypothetical protein